MRSNDDDRDAALTALAELAKEIEAEFDLHPIFTADPYEVKEWAPDDYLHRAGEYRTADEERALLCRVSKLVAHFQ